MIPRHVNSILVEAWVTFKVPAGNSIRDIFVKTNILLLIPPNLNMITKEYNNSVQVPSESKYEEIN